MKTFYVVGKNAYHQSLLARYLNMNGIPCLDAGEADEVLWVKRLQGSAGIICFGAGLYPLDVALIMSALVAGQKVYALGTLHNESPTILKHPDVIWFGSKEELRMNYHP